MCHSGWGRSGDAGGGAKVIVMLNSPYSGFLASLIAKGMKTPIRELCVATESKLYNSLRSAGRSPE